MMASNSKKRPGSVSAPPPVRAGKGLPWLTIAATALVVILAGAVAWVVIAKNSEEAALDSWVPTADNRDPSVNIDGIYVGVSSDEAGINVNREPIVHYSYPQYVAAMHVTADQRVDYDRYPPVGGPHDGQWADCRGVVYTKPVRDENMVHTLEHGAIWIAYNPDLPDAEVNKLKTLVEGQNFISMSPYPGLKVNVSLQAWAHQLQVDSVDDPRIKQFITALRRNDWVYPETGATCDPGTNWDNDNPPAFDGSPRGKKAVQMDGKGATDDSAEQMGGNNVATAPALPPTDAATGPAADSTEPSAGGTAASPGGSSGSPATASAPAQSSAPATP